MNTQSMTPQQWEEMMDEQLARYQLTNNLIKLAPKGYGDTHKSKKPRRWKDKKRDEQRR